MIRLFQCGVRLLAVLVCFYFAVIYSYTAFVYVIPLWCAWLLFVIPKWKGRLLVASGFGLIALSWWLGAVLWAYFATRIEGSHFREDGEYWVGLSASSDHLGKALMVAGILLLTWADYRRPIKAKPGQGLPTEVIVNESGIWPPTPKKPPQG